MKVVRILYAKIFYLSGLGSYDVGSSVSSGRTLGSQAACAFFSRKNDKKK